MKGKEILDTRCGKNYAQKHGPLFVLIVALLNGGAVSLGYAPTDPVIQPILLGLAATITASINYYLAKYR